MPGLHLTDLVTRGFHLLTNFPGNHKAISNQQAIAVACRDAYTGCYDPGQVQWIAGVNPDQLIVNKRQIQIGGVSGSASIEVLKGLKTGDRVVTAGIKKLREGMLVKLLD